jgi:hypothetical protein
MVPFRQCQTCKDSGKNIPGEGMCKDPGNRLCKFEVQREVRMAGGGEIQSRAGKLRLKSRQGLDLVSTERLWIFFPS